MTDGGLPALIADGLIMLTALAVAALALYHRRVFACAVLFIVFGLMMSLAWLRLGAPDVALAEAAIGAGITGALLIATLSRLVPGNGRQADAPPASRQPEPGDAPPPEKP